MWSQDDSDDEVLVMVVRTGWNTAAGSMLREVVASSRPSVQKPLVQVTSHGPSYSTPLLSGQPGILPGFSLN